MSGNRLIKVLATGCLLLLAGCDGDQEEGASMAVQPRIAEVEVLSLQLQPWLHSIEAFGRIVAAEKVVIGVETAGTVARVLFTEGQGIEAGQLLLELEDNKQRLRLERAAADVARSRAELAQAQGTYERYRALIGRRVVSEQDFKQTESAYNAAQARVEQAIAAEKLAQQELRDLSLISPVDGVVEHEAVEPGQKVRPGEELAIVQAGTSLQVVSYVTEKEVNLLHPGDLAPMTSPGVAGREYQARIESIGSTADPKTGNFPVKLRVDNSDGLLREGMSARITLQSSEPEQRLLVPRHAVVDRDRQRVVFVVREGRAFQLTPSLGMGQGDWVVVRSGLSAGDQLVVSNLPQLNDGSELVVVAAGEAGAMP